MADVKDIADRVLEVQPHKVCPGCSHSWIWEAIYCGYCGEKLREVEVPPPNKQINPTY